MIVGSPQHPGIKRTNKREHSPTEIMGTIEGAKLIEKKLGKIGTIALLTKREIRSLHLKFTKFLAG